MKDKSVQMMQFTVIEGRYIPETEAGGPEALCYGLRMKWPKSDAYPAGAAAEVKNISTSRAEVEALGKKLLVNEITPATLYDVIEDYVADRDTVTYTSRYFDLPAHA